MGEHAGGVEGTPGVEHRVLTVEDGSLSVYTAGAQGRPDVVLLHGAMYDEARFAWDQMFSHLATQFRVHAVDLPRHGSSRPWGGALRHERLRGILHEGFGRLGLQRFSIVGLSMGGGLAIEYAALHPDRVVSMALFEPGGLGVRLDRHFLTWAYTRTPGLGRALTKTYRRKSLPELRRVLDSLFVGGSRPTDPDRLVRILKAEIDAKWHPRERDLDDWQTAAIGLWRLRWNVLDLIPGIACPTLWLRGSDSALVKQDEMEHAVALARSTGQPTEFTVIPGAGHLLPLERPAEANAAVVEFLLRTTG